MEDFTCRTNDGLFNVWGDNFSLLYLTMMEDLIVVLVLTDILIRSS